GQCGRRALAGLRRRRAVEQRGHHRVLERREVTEQVVELEHEADILTTVARERGLAAAKQLFALKQHAPPGRAIERAEQVQQRRFADAGRADERHQLGRADLDRGATKHTYELGAGTVLALEFDAGEQRVRHGGEARTHSFILLCRRGTFAGLRCPTVGERNFRSFILLCRRGACAEPPVPDGRRKKLPLIHSSLPSGRLRRASGARRSAAETTAHSYLSTSTGASAPARRAGTIVARKDSKSAALPIHTKSPDAR